MDTNNSNVLSSGAILEALTANGCNKVLPTPAAEAPTPVEAPTPAHTPTRETLQRYLTNYIQHEIDLLDGIYSPDSLEQWIRLGIDAYISIYLT